MSESFFNFNVSITIYHNSNYWSNQFFGGHCVQCCMYDIIIWFIILHTQNECFEFLVIIFFLQTHHQRLEIWTAKWWNHQIISTKSLCRNIFFVKNSSIKNIWICRFNGFDFIRTYRDAALNVMRSYIFRVFSLFFLHSYEVCKAERSMYIRLKKGIEQLQQQYHNHVAVHYNCCTLHVHSAFELRLFV